MMTTKRGVILVGHGGIPKGCPSELVSKLKRLEGQRRATNMPMSAEELELDTRIRQMPRTPETDPYQAGLESVATQLKASLGNVLFAIAYNEFCAPTLEASVEELVKKGATSITVVTTMVTPGGSHSEVEIPEILDQLRPQYPGVALRYAWPFDLKLVADTFAEQVNRFSS
ncbi:MAG: Sirohydrochlorin cobaltochelatase [Nitrospira sp.]|nr:Sirohydrochlorin cobaltochelatase [Nitrospira sp.]